MLRARKVEYIVHMEKLDDEGNVADEIVTQKPLTLFAHQFDRLSDEVAQIVTQVEQQPSGGQVSG